MRPTQLWHKTVLGLALALCLAQVGLGVGRPAAAAVSYQGLFLKKSNLPADQFQEPRVAVDAAGVIHAAYGSPFNGQPAGYAECSANCASPANWLSTTVGNSDSEGRYVQLALDPQGHPRLLIQGVNANIGYDRVIQYAECDTGCTQARNWTVLTLLHVQDDFGVVSEPFERSFALDPQGSPRFIYFDSTVANAGTWMAYCDVACTTLGNWYQFALSPLSAVTSAKLYDPALTFTSQGMPRFVAWFKSASQSALGDGIQYAACDSGCNLPANWTTARLFSRGFGTDPFWTLRLDGSDRPRLAFFQGTPGVGSDQDAVHKLHYAWCNTNCSQAGQWSKQALGLADGQGIEPDLALDGSGNPHVVYQLPTSPSQLGYSECTGSCSSGTPTWQHTVVETSATLNADWTIAPPINCNASGWDAGHVPSLAFSPSGTLVIAHEARNMFFDGAYCAPGEASRNPRFVLAAGAVAPNYPNRVFLPVLRY